MFSVEGTSSSHLKGRAIVSNRGTTGFSEWRCYKDTHARDTDSLSCFHIKRANALFPSNQIDINAQGDAGGSKSYAVEDLGKLVSYAACLWLTALGGNSLGTRPYDIVSTDPCTSYVSGPKRPCAVRGPSTSPGQARYPGPCIQTRLLLILLLLRHSYPLRPFPPHDDSNLQPLHCSRSLQGSNGNTVLLSLRSQSAAIYWTRSPRIGSLQLQ